MHGNMLNQAEGQPLSQNQRDAYRVTRLEQRIGICEGREQDMLKRITVLEQQIANQAIMMKNRDDTVLKAQAAQQQAQGSNYLAEQIEAQEKNLYAPLRSDTKPLLEMSAFVRHVAALDPNSLSDELCIRELVDIVFRAQELLKRST
jgi:uncharacterized coiled-coil protein SlyX